MIEFTNCFQNAKKNRQKPLSQKHNYWHFFLSFACYQDRLMVQWHLGLCKNKTSPLCHQWRCSRHNPVLNLEKHEVSQAHQRRRWSNSQYRSKHYITTKLCKDLPAHQSQMQGIPATENDVKEESRGSRLVIETSGYVMIMILTPQASSNESCLTWGDITGSWNRPVMV